MKRYPIFFSVISLCGCIFIFSRCSNQSIVEYSIDSFLESIRIETADTIPVNVCDIIEAEWDSILVIKPYTQVPKQAVLKDLKNYFSIKSRIRDIRQTDFYSYLVFVRNDRAIGFSRVPPVPVDFADLPVSDNHSPGVAVVSKTNCARLYMKKNGGLFIAK